MHAGHMGDELSARERAMRRLPVPYSLALRLRDAGVAPEVVCEYVGVGEGALPGVYRIAEAKLTALEQHTSVDATSAAEPAM
jgi:hypothetical protein